jgi:hypothetical protein
MFVLSGAAPCMKIACSISSLASYACKTRAFACKQIRQCLIQLSCADLLTTAIGIDPCVGFESIKGSLCVIPVVSAWSFTGPRMSLVWYVPAFCEKHTVTFEKLDKDVSCCDDGNGVHQVTFRV